MQEVPLCCNGAGGGGSRPIRDWSYQDLVQDLVFRIYIMTDKHGMEWESAKIEPLRSQPVINVPTYI